MRREKLTTEFYVALAIYISLHVLLSRIGTSIASGYGMKEVFYYVPTSIDSMMESKTLYAIHLGLRVLFYPAWKIDELFGGPSPMLSLPLRLQNPK